MCLATVLAEECISEVVNWYAFQVLVQDMTKFCAGGFSLSELLPLRSQETMDSVVGGKFGKKIDTD